jgi:hypothetical protein
MFKIMEGNKNSSKKKGELLRTHDTTKFG